MRRVAVAVACSAFAVVVLAQSYLVSFSGDSQATAPPPFEGFCVACPNHLDCAPDCCPPYKYVDIDGQTVVSLNSTTGSTATFEWTATPEDTQAEIQYGLTTTYGSEKLGTASGYSGSIQLSGLTAYATYYYEVTVGSNMDCYVSAQATGSFVPYYGHTLSMEFVIYNDSGTITIGSGPPEASGYQTTVYSPSTLPVSFSISSSDQSAGESLQAWYTSAGSFANATSASTDFDVFTSDLSGVASVALSNSSLNWAGYSESGSGITSVTGTFVLPSSVSYMTGVSNGISSTDSVAFWVGIGGVSGDQNLWQAGVVISVTSSTTTIQGLISDVDGLKFQDSLTQLSSSATDIFYHNASAEYCAADSGPSDLDISLGDTITVTLLYSSDSGPLPGDGYGTNGNFYINDTTNGGEWYGYNMCLEHAPDQTTADFVEEAPEQVTSAGYAPAVLPDMASSSYTLYESMTTSVGPFPELTPESPMLAWGLCNYTPQGTGDYTEQSLTSLFLQPSSAGSAQFYIYFQTEVVQGTPPACSAG